MSALRTCAVVIAAGIAGYLFGACSGLARVRRCHCAPPPPMLLGSFEIEGCDPPITGAAVVTERTVTIDYQADGASRRLRVEYAVQTPWRGIEVPGPDLWSERWNLASQLDRWCPSDRAAVGRCCGSDTPKRAICANASATCLRNPDRTGWYRHECTIAKKLCQRVKRASARCSR